MLHETEQTPIIPQTKEDAEASELSDKLKAFEEELKALGEELRKDIGPKDAAYIRKIRKISRSAEGIGRALIHLGMSPISWGMGVLALSIHYQLETTEIGHMALHGCWDGLEGAEDFNSETFRWRAPVEESSWKREHNGLHHQYTNIVGKDPDLNYGGFRITEKTDWWPYNLVQAAQFFWTAPFFMWVIGGYTTGLTDFFNLSKSKTYPRIMPEKNPRTILKAFKQTGKKMLSYSLREYVMWPLLAGPFWWKVLAGNLSAEVLKNIYTAATIYAAHFGDDLKYYDPDYKPKSRGEWYKAQVEAAQDFRVPKWVSILCGALDYQIEHHLFPKVPPNRLREIADRVEDICKRHGVKYVKKRWDKALSNALERLVRFSVPSNWKSRLERFLPSLAAKPAR